MTLYCVLFFCYEKDPSNVFPITDTTFLDIIPEINNHTISCLQPSEKYYLKHPLSTDVIFSKYIYFLTLFNMEPNENILKKIGNNSVICLKKNSKFDE